MGTGRLTIDLAAIAANWRALDALTDARCETAAVVKADAYGLGLAPVARALAEAGARRFFVADAAEGVRLRDILGPGPVIMVFAGHMAGDAGMLAAAGLVPMLNSPEQIARHMATLPDHDFGLQLDSGMNRLGLEPEDLPGLGALLDGAKPVLVMSHLACAEEADAPMNRAQRDSFTAMLGAFGAPRSLSATGGILLGGAYHFDLTRPGVGLYGGAPFSAARPVVRLALPVIQSRELQPGETVGYGNSWTAPGPRRIATVAGGYADGLPRALSNRTRLFAGDIACPLVGRVSMDLITVDVTHLPEVPDHLDILGPHQGVDALAADAGTIGYEILTGLGPRYDRRYEGAA